MNPKELSRIVNYKEKKRQSLMPEPKTLSPPYSIFSPQDETRGSMDFSPKSGGGAGALLNRKKYKYPIKSINEFIQKMLKKEIATTLSQTLS